MSILRRLAADISITSTQTAAKARQAERDEIERLTQEYLAKGGEITRIETPLDRTGKVFCFNNSQHKLEESKLKTVDQ